MPARKNANKLTGMLDRLEAAYGPLMPSEDAVEAGVLTLLAIHAPRLSTVQTRQSLREWFVDWNEMRVADPWDITHAMAAGGDSGARAFATATLRMLRSLHSVLNRAGFDRAVADPDADVDALIDKMRGVPMPARAVMRAVLAGGDAWRPDKEMSKLVQKLGLCAKTTSLTKVGRALADQSSPDDRLRGHYLLARYAVRKDGDEDPLATTRARRAPAKKSAAKATKPAKATAAKSTKTSTKTASKKPAAKKPAAKKPAAKKSKKPAAKRSG